MTTGVWKTRDCTASRPPRARPRRASASVVVPAAARAAIVPVAARRVRTRAPAAASASGFEGGQMPIYMRVSKLRGSNKKMSMPMGPFRTHTLPVNVGAARAVRGGHRGHARAAQAGRRAQASQAPGQDPRSRRADREAVGHRARGERQRAREDRGCRWHHHADRGPRAPRSRRRPSSRSRLRTRLARPARPRPTSRRQPRPRRRRRPRPRTPRTPVVTRPDPPRDIGDSRTGPLRRTRSSWGWLAAEGCVRSRSPGAAHILLASAPCSRASCPRELRERIPPPTRAAVGERLSQFGGLEQDAARPAGRSLFEPRGAGVEQDALGVRTAPCSSGRTRSDRVRPDEADYVRRRGRSGWSRSHMVEIKPSMCELVACRAAGVPYAVADTRSSRMLPG